MPGRQDAFESGDAPSAAYAITLAELSRRLGAELLGPGDACVRSINSLGEAGPMDVTFVASADYARALVNSAAAGAIISRAFVDTAAGCGRPLLVVPDAEVASAAALAIFEPAPSLPDVGVHPTAWVHATVRMGAGVRIGPHVSIDRGCVLLDGVVLHAGVRLYADVTIGAASVLHSGTVVRERCCIGASVILHQNVSIGADGFGYRPAPGGRGLVKMPHIGNVVLEDDVEIGANSCVDRGKFGATRIGAGTKIDNLCQIGHNCRIGRSCVIAGLTGVSGSVTIGDGCRIGGQVGIADHVTIGAGASIGAMSGVMRDVPAGASQVGLPAEDAKTALRKEAALRKLPDLLKKLSRAADAGRLESGDRPRSV